MLKNNIMYVFYYTIIALPVNTSHFEAGDGPILLDNVACNKSHSNLSQCVYPVNIGVQFCIGNNIAGVECLEESQNSQLPQSLILSSVGSVLVILTLAITGLIVAVVLVKRKRKTAKRRSV